MISNYYRDRKSANPPSCDYKALPCGTGPRPLRAGVLLGAMLFLAMGLAACDSDQDPSASADTESPGQEKSSGAAAPPDSQAVQEADGVITATFNGTERTWYITSAERSGRYVSQSDWSSYSAGQGNVSIMGHVSPSWPFKSGEAIMIGFMLQGTGENPAVVDPSITFLSGGIMNNHSSDHDGNANISVASASIDGETLTISGTFSGTLPFKSYRGDADVESTETIVVENGTFEGVVRPLEDP